MPKAWLLCLILCPGTAFAQYRFDTWTTDNGLPQNGVREITQTPDGYLWFTTFDGLVRFDGVRFTTFGTGNTRGIINNRFTGLYGAADGTTMKDGILTVYRDGVFTSYTSSQVPGHYIQRIAPDARGELRFLVEDDDRTSKSWYYLRDGAFVFAETEVLPPVITIAGPSGAVWRVTTREAVEERDGALTTYPLTIGPLTYRPNVFVDRSGFLGIGEHAVHRVGGGRVHRFGERDGLTPSIHHSFWQDADGAVWVVGGGGSTQGVGLARFEGDRVQTFGLDSGLLNTTIFSVFHDREGTTWLATNRGLGRLRRKVLTSYSTRDGITHTEVYPIYRDRQDRIWVGTTRGLSIYEDGRFTTPVFRGWRDDIASVQSLWEDAGGRLWVGLNGGLYVIEGGTARLLPAAAGHHVFAIAGERQGVVWAATNKGLLQFREREYVATLGVKDGLSNGFMATIVEDSQGRLWFGGFGGLSRYSAGTFTNYTTRDGLTGSYVRTIDEDADGTLWIPRTSLLRRDRSAG